MDELKNPFAPGAGIQPPELSGRNELLHRAEVVIHRTSSGRLDKSFIAVGLRGVGKTVVLNRIASIAEKYDCLYTIIEMNENSGFPETIIPEIRKILFSLRDKYGIVSAVTKAFRVFKSFLNSIKFSYNDFDIGFDFDPEVGIADNRNIDFDIPDLFTALGEAAQESKKTIVFILDEIQYLSEKEMSAFIMALHKTSQRGLPILLLGAGLPLLVGRMGKSKSYAERLFDFPEIGALEYVEACDALNVPAKKEHAIFSNEALKKIYLCTKGYPYFLQEWGYTCWNIASNNTITVDDVNSAIPLVTKKLDSGFFRVRFDRLTRKERIFLRAMAELGEGPYKYSDIAEKLGISAVKLGPCRASLISKGMIFSHSHGTVAFTVPLFDQYVARVMPFSTWNAPE